MEPFNSMLEYDHVYETMLDNTSLGQFLTIHEEYRKINNEENEQISYLYCEEKPRVNDPKYSNMIKIKDFIKMVHIKKNKNKNQIPLKLVEHNPRNHISAKDLIGDMKIIPTTTFSDPQEECPYKERWKIKHKTKRRKRNNKKRRNQIPYKLKIKYNRKKLGKKTNQKVCCFSKCNKKITPRSINSLKHYGESRLDWNYVSRGYFKICSYHYFSDMYHYKKSIGKLK